MIYFVDTKVDHCRQIWSLVHEYGVQQILGVVARGSGKPILRHKPARQGNRWITEHTGDKWFGENTKLVNLVKTQLEKGDKLGLHGLYHISYRKEPYSVQLEHLRAGKDYLENLFGVEVKHFVPPFNGYNTYTEKATKKLGLEITTPPVGELDVFMLDANKTKEDIRERARLVSAEKNHQFYHPFLLGGDWEAQKIYIKRHNKYTDIPPPTWGLEWALSRFEVYLKEMRRSIDSEAV